MIKGPDVETYDSALHEFMVLYPQCDKTYFKEYLEFSRFIQGCFLSKDGYIVDTGNFQTVNRQLIVEIKRKIEKHPLLWKLFFMIA